MIITKTAIEGVYIIDLEPRIDNRGSFSRVFCKDELSRMNITFDIVQINRSFTKEKGTIRGMHFQEDPQAEDKIVQCVKGSIFDVALDIRKHSPTYGKWIAEELTEKNNKMLLIPKGCAHGFQSMENKCLVEYFVSQFYSPNQEKGIRWNDPQYNISWPVPSAILSDKDKNWPLL